MSARTAAGGSGTKTAPTATVTDSTVSDNSGAAYGSGILNEGALSVVHSTLSGNNSFVGGGGIGLQRARPPSSPPSWLGTQGGNCAVSDGNGNRPGMITDGGYNLDDDGSCGLSSANGSFSDTPGGARRRRPAEQWGPHPDHRPRTRQPGHRRSDRRSGLHWHRPAGSAVAEPL